MNKQSYGYFNGSYFTIHDGNPTYIPENADYKHSAMQSSIYDNKYCIVDAYVYNTDFITECNPQRVGYMKELLINEKVKDIFDLNEDYIVGIDYTLYDDAGKPVVSSVSSVRAIYHDAIINSDIQAENILEYRKGLIFDGSIEIRIPKKSSYGIKKLPNKTQSYTLKINKFLVSSTVGENRFNIDSDEQTNCHGRWHASCCQYNLHHTNHLLFNDYSAHFLTNAHVGTTIIDQMVVPAELQIPPEYTQVRMAEIPCEGTTFTVKIKPVESIVVNIEVVLDNSLVVYNKADIDAIIEANRHAEDNDDDEPVVIPIDNPTDPVEDPTDNPTNDNPSTDTPVTDNPSTDNTESNTETTTDTNTDTTTETNTETTTDTTTETNGTTDTVTDTNTNTDTNNTNNP